MNNQILYQKIYLALLMMLGWFALAAQFYINWSLSKAPLGEVIMRYISYFTLLTNGIVAIICTLLLSGIPGKIYQFSTKSSVATAVAVYITVVGVIYNCILRFLWHPSGLQMVVDELLHSVIPVLYFVYWLVFVNKTNLRWTSIPSWLVYPLLYTIFILVKGSYSHFYPYPFINVNELGMQKVLINSVGMTFVFLFFSIAYIAIGKLQTRYKTLK